MAGLKDDPKSHPLRMSGSHGIRGLVLLGAVVDEGFDRLTRTEIEFASADRAIDLEAILGSSIRIEMDLPESKPRSFEGTCVTIEFLGHRTGAGHYRAEIRPWAWFLTRRADCKVFQELTVIDILKEVLAEHGKSGSLDDRTAETYPPREFCLQYRETDLDFIRRLLEEEGIYHWFEESDDGPRMVIADGPAAHAPMEEPTLPYQPRAADQPIQLDHLFEWRTQRAAQTGKLTLTDYDCEKPKADLTATVSIPSGRHDLSDREVYDYPARIRDAAEVKRFARIRMEAEAARFHLVRGVGNATRLHVGKTFTLADHPRKAENDDWLVTRLVHRMTLEESEIPQLTRLGGIADGAGWQETYRVEVEAIPARLQYRPPRVTPLPRISGIQTAVVVGPEGEEIAVDRLGRIKVQFHWDRLGESDETSSCWIRCAHPWSGAGWGAVWHPRIGQEVVVQFEEGNPDRPIVTGMLYNEETMPPWELPENRTQTGLRTNSSKGGGGFHELMFEDKKDAELVRFQSERDYRQIVKNDAEITVGLEHRDKGDMSLTVHRNLTEKLDTGDHAFTVAEGSQEIDVAKDKTEKIGGNSTLTVTGNVTETVEQGNVSLGVDLGKITHQAMQSIELKVGSNSIKIDQTGVTIKGMMVKIQGTAMLEAKAPMSTVKGDGLLILKGGLTMIN